MDFVVFCFDLSKFRFMCKYFAFYSRILSTSLFFRWLKVSEVVFLTIGLVDVVSDGLVLSSVYKESAAYINTLQELRNNENWNKGSQYLIDLRYQWNNMTEVEQSK